MSDNTADIAVIARLREAQQAIKTEMAKVSVGQDEIIESLLISLLCRGHVLLHGVPGLGKTLMARTLARCLDLEFRRVQFTPDLMPSDITGTDVLKEDHAGRYSTEFQPGPVFTNFLLADEINRTPPKTQAARDLERQVPRRFRRSASRRDRRHATPPGVELPRASRRCRCGFAHRATRENSTDGSLTRDAKFQNAKSQIPK